MENAALPSRGILQRIRGVAVAMAVLTVCPAVAQTGGAEDAAPAAGKIYHSGWADLNKNGRKDVYEDASAPLEARVADLLAQMTLEEKTNQTATLYGFGRVLKDALPTPAWKQAIWKDGIANIDEHLNGLARHPSATTPLSFPFSRHADAINRVQRWFVEETRLGIPVDFSNEGIHGLNHDRATPLPAPINLGATWNSSAILAAGRMVGRQARALGYTNVYAPILDLARDPRWGRVVETYGEDPFLVARLGTGMTRGIQESGVAATLKHYAVYGIPKGGRDGYARTDPHVAPREMHQLHMYPFQQVIRDAKPMGVMASYNDWDGEPIIASHYFLTALLREEYGFDGVVVSDSEAVEFVQTKHRVAADAADAIRQVMVAGLNVRTNFTPPDDFILPLRQLIRDGRLSPAVLDARVADVLRLKFRLGLFDRPYVDAKAADRQVDTAADRALSLKLNRESMVLLKNESGLLPLDPGRHRHILVTGPLAEATNYAIRRYGPSNVPVISVLDGIRSQVGNKVTVTYAKGVDLIDAGWPDSEIVDTPMTAAEEAGVAQAVAAARTADVVVAVVGEDATLVGESLSRTGLNLPGRQLKLLQALHATGKPVVMVTINGRPLTMNWESRNLPAILQAGFPGPQAGTVIAETLFGANNPGGKLTVTVPRSIGQIELNFPFKPGSHASQPFSGPNGAGKTRVNGALYPFGYGLSYTSFAYRDPVVSWSRGDADNIVTVEGKVRNTGERAGDEVVQLYLRDLVSSVTTYEKTLRGFQRVALTPGEEKVVRFQLRCEDFALLDKQMHFVVEPGTFEVEIASSSEDIRLHQRLDVTAGLCSSGLAAPASRTDR